MNMSFLGRLIIVLLSTATLIGLCWFVLTTKPTSRPLYNKLVTGTNQYGDLSLFHDLAFGKAVGSFHNNQKGEFVQIEVLFERYPPKEFGKDLTALILKEVDHLERQGSSYQWMRVNYTNPGDYSIISGLWESPTPST